MDDPTLFPPATTEQTVAFCWRQVGPQRARLVLGWCLIALGTLANAVAGPIVLAAILDRIATLPAHADLWSTFGTLIIAYACVLAASTVLWRIAGWVEWGVSIRSFGQAITNGYDHLVSLSHRWYTDRPAGEVFSTLETFSWSFMELIDVTNWGFVRIAVTALGAVAVLAFVAWPVALVIFLLVLVFSLVLLRRMGGVVTSSKRFSDTHSRASGVIADTIANLTTIRAQASEDAEREHVAEMVHASITADLKARRIFAATRLQMESSLAFFSWVAVFVGIVLALRHQIAAGVVYLVLFYATQIVATMDESFEHIRSVSRDLGRCAKFAGIACSVPEIRDAPEATELAVPEGRVQFHHVRFAYPSHEVLFADLTLDVRAGEHVGLVGQSGSGKTTLTRLLLRFMDIEGGGLCIDGQDVRSVTQHSLRRHIAYVPQDPQMLHRSIAENICYGLGAVDLDLVREVGRAAHVEEFVSRLPAGYGTVVGERGLKLSGGQRQRVAIAQAMAKQAPILILDEATAALDSESETLVQEALWRLMEKTTALVVAHRLSTVARMDRIVVLDHGCVVEQGSHRELLAAGEDGVYARLWHHQSGGFLAE